MFPRFLFWLIVLTEIVSAQSPFQFREAWLLEMRMQRGGRILYEDRLQLAGRELLTHADAALWRGEFETSEAQYQNFLDGIRQKEGPTAVNLAWMLDHIGQSYLEIRDFGRAYKNFSEAVRILRTNIASASPDPQQSRFVINYRAHLDRLLVALGRLDFAKGDVDLANQELAEAAAIGNNLARLWDANNAIYFQSLALEQQGKWEDAEKVWQQAAKLREKMTLSDPYWDLLKDMAAFYARHGDFHTAAEIVRRIQTETAGKILKPFADVPDIPDWYGNEMRIQDRSSMFKEESDAATADILAMDTWLSEGPDAAAPLLSAKSIAGLTREENTDLTEGFDSDRARLLGFLTARSFLRMSILLDGNPSPERVAQAYEAIRGVKGRYLATIANLVTGSESDRNNPSVGYSPASGTPIMLDELAADRTHHAHLLVASALDGKSMDNRELVRSEQAEQAITETLAYAKRHQMRYGHWSLSDFVQPDTAIIDLTAWNRIDRDHPTTSHREYGAFIFKKAEPIQYVRLGAAEDIDQDVTALEAGVVGTRTRGVQVNPERSINAPDETNERLKRLYKEVISPLEPALTGVTKLAIVPDGKLTLAPIGAFIAPEGRYLLQRYTIYYTGYDLLGHAPDPRGPNRTIASVVFANPDFNAQLPGSHEASGGPNRALFDPLPSAELEASDVQQALHLTSDRVLTGKLAREEAMRSLGGPEILHFATHSVPYMGWKDSIAPYDLFEFPRPLATQDPLLQSVIALSGANHPQTGPEDGLLTGLEIASLRLYGTKLVVLSTCEAGQGTPVDGQGVLGLRAAFSMAGVQGLVMSLWPVDDKAGRQFMQFFYSHLGAGPSEAVRLAQLDMIAKTEYKQPRYWAGYSFSGELAMNNQSAKVAAKPAPPVSDSKGPDTGPKEVLARPTCLELTTHDESGNYSYVNTIRVKIGGNVRRSATSAERTVYDLLPPSSDLEQSTAMSVNHGPLIADPDIKRASRGNFPVSLTMERTKNQSAVYVRQYVAEGDKRGYKPGTMLLISLKGGPDLFPTFDLPAAFPNLSSYTEASIVQSASMGNAAKIDSIGVCVSR
jgi:CHAT domain-containing protein